MGDARLQRGEIARQTQPAGRQAANWLTAFGLTNITSMPARRPAAMARTASGSGAGPISIARLVSTSDNVGLDVKITALDPELEQATLRELNDALSRAFSEISSRGGMLS